MDWRKEYRGTHVAYADGKEVAAVQGSGVQGWRYRLGLGEWSDFHGTVGAAKRSAENALSVETT